MATEWKAPLNFDLEKHLEFVDGCLLERPLGTGPHSDLQFTITRLLKPLAKQHGFIARQEYTFAHGTEWLVPDVLVASQHLREDHRGYLVTTPHLCVEILSPGQNESELFRKCRRYHAWGVPHCWVIDPAPRACFEYHGGTSFSLVEPDGTLSAEPLHLSAAELWQPE